MPHFLDFEKPIADLEGKIEELRHLSDGEINIADEVGKLEEKVERQLRQTYGRLNAWQKVQVARHPGRPKCGDYVSALIEDFVPLAGDRLFSEDAALVAGLGRFRGRAVAVLGHEKGQRYRQPHRPQFRHGAAGRLSQGPAGHGFGEPVRSAAAVFCRYLRRLSRRGGGRARTVRSDCPFDPVLPGADRPVCLGHHRRGRLRRGDSDRHGEQGLHA